jgi:menaquinone-dependent protoporphyrinogen oxidase
MTNILVIFGTTDGHTRKVAQFLAASLRAADSQVECDVIRAGRIDISPRPYDAVIVCASVHAGKYQKAVSHWVRRHAATLAQKPTAFLSVCLGVLEKDPAVDRQLDAIVERFFAGAGWHANRVKQIAGALLYTKYGWLKRWIMKRIAAKAGGDVDTTRDYEYTNWEDLQAFAEEFTRLVVPHRPSAKPDA